MSESKQYIRRSESRSKEILIEAKEEAHNITLRTEKKFNRIQLDLENAELDEDENQSNLQYQETGAVTSQLEEVSPTPESIEYLRAFSNSRLQSSSNKALATDFARQLPMFFEQYEQNELITFPNGRRGLLSTAENYAEYQYGSIQLYKDILKYAEYEAGISRRHLKKYLMPDLLQAHNKSLNKYVQDQQALITEETKSRQKEELRDAIAEENPGEGLADWIKTYHGYHKYSWATGRKEAFTMLGELIKENRIEFSDIEELKKSIIMGNDGQPHIIEEYWGDDPHFSE